ncbi:hypothetical protein [Bacillus safensis]|nr:hypothetical protein [Bacillus safensis]
MKKKTFVTICVVGGLVVSVLGVGGSFTYAEHKKKEKIQLEHKENFSVAKSAVGSLYKDNKKKEPKTKLNKYWKKDVLVLINKVDGNKKEQLLKEVEGIDSMVKVRESVTRFIKKGVLVTPKSRSGALGRIHDDQLKDAEKALMSLSDRDSYFYKKMKKEIDEGKKQISALKKIEQSIKNNKTKNASKLKKQIKAILNEDDRNSLFNLLKKVEKKEKERTVSQKKSSEEKSVGSVSVDAPQSKENAKDNGSSVNNGGNTASKEQTGTSNRNNNNQKRNSSTSNNNGGSSYNKPQKKPSYNKPSVPSKNKPSGNKPSGNKGNKPKGGSNMDDINDVINNINNGNTNKVGSGEIDKGGNSYDEYEIIGGK